MRPVVLTCALLAVVVGFSSCADAPPERAALETRTAADVAQAKEAILDALNAETRDALGRDYEDWRTHWVHAPYVAKTYINLADGSASETLGWTAVDDFVRTYLEAHPEPETPPAPLTDADVRLYGDGAWVSYEQDDADQGRKRETRLMERVDGAWKIAGMHTTIYGVTRSD
ncbi:MAG: nuclear transport factor 2 family protein [Bacteroidota bacterium]